MRGQSSSEFMLSVAVYLSFIGILVGYAMEHRERTLSAIGVLRDRADAIQRAYEYSEYANSCGEIYYEKKGMVEIESGVLKSGKGQVKGSWRVCNDDQT